MIFLDSQESNNSILSFLCDLGEFNIIRDNASEKMVNFEFKSFN